MVDASRIESPVDAIFNGSVRSWEAAGVVFPEAGAFQNKLFEVIVSPKILSGVLPYSIQGRNSDNELHKFILKFTDL